MNLKAETIKDLKHIIFVDDNKSEFFLSERIFREFMPKAKLLWFPDGDKFLHFMKSGIPQSSDSIVLMDVNMPGKGAREILEEMKKDGLVGKIRVIVMSVFQKYADKDYFASFPNVSFVKKPCGLIEYRHFINSFLL